MDNLFVIIWTHNSDHTVGIVGVCIDVELADFYVGFLSKRDNQRTFSVVGCPIISVDTVAEKIGLPALS